MRRMVVRWLLLSLDDVEGEGGSVAAFSQSVETSWRNPGRLEVSALSSSASLPLRKKSQP